MKRGSIVIICIFLLCCLSACNKEHVEEDTMIPQSVEMLAQKYYGEFLLKYHNYEANGFNGEMEGINLIYADELYNPDGFQKELYYTLIDLADDGTPELFISDKEIIYDTYALDEVSGQVKALVEHMVHI